MAWALTAIYYNPLWPDNHANFGKIKKADNFCKSSALEEGEENMFGGIDSQIETCFNDCSDERGGDNPDDF